MAKDTFEFNKNVERTTKRARILEFDFKIIRNKIKVQFLLNKYERN